MTKPETILESALKLKYVARVLISKPKAEEWNFQRVLVLDNVTRRAIRLLAPDLVDLPECAEIFRSGRPHPPIKPDWFKQLVRDCLATAIHDSGVRRYSAYYTGIEDDAEYDAEALETFTGLLPLLLATALAQHVDERAELARAVARAAAERQEARDSESPGSLVRRARQWQARR